MLNVFTGDIIEWAKKYDGPKFHASLCDAPYEYGFMNKSWDDKGVSFSSETWSAIGEHLLPGAFGMTYGGSRTWHRMAVAIEDAGLVIHPSIFVWLYSQGMYKGVKINNKIEDEDLASAWEGHRYGLQAIRPAAEPIIIFQKPYGQDVYFRSIIESGAGAINIDGARLDTKAQSFEDNREDKVAVSCYGKYGPIDYDGSKGRIPQNFAMCHSRDCVEASSGNARLTSDDYVLMDGWLCHPECPVRIFNEGNGKFQSTARVGKRSGKPFGVYGSYVGQDEVEMGHDDDGYKSKYYYIADWSYEVYESLNKSEGQFYCPKASTAERESGLEDIEATGRAGRKNIHPTVKPIKLNVWLSTLLSPPSEYSPRRLLIPFAGVMSEAIGAMLSGGWESIYAVEIVPEHVDIGIARYNHWHEISTTIGSSDPSVILKCEVEKPVENAVQRALF